MTMGATSTSGTLDVTPDYSRRVLNAPLLNAVGWLLYGIIWGLGPLMERPWHEYLAMNAPYVLIGYLLSLPLGWLYDRLGVGPASFGRSLLIIVPGSYIAGVIWLQTYHTYQVVLAPAVHSILIDGPSPFNVPRHVPIISRALGSAVPMFGWSVLRLGLQYNTALRQQREQALHARAAARDAQLRMLAYQLNPHFLFNTLNSIRALINEDGQRAREMVTALSGYLRYALVERPLHVTLLEEEVSSVHGYLAIEKVRFEERLIVNIDIAPAALRCEVPAFLLNPLVENAVKHGAAGTADAPLVLRIEAGVVEPDRLRLTVTNTGGWGGALSSRAVEVDDDDGGGGVGLANVRARLAALYPGDHRIEIDESEATVRVTVELPARLRSEGAA